MTAIAFFLSKIMWKNSSHTDRLIEKSNDSGNNKAKEFQFIQCFDLNMKKNIECHDVT